MTTKFECDGKSNSSGRPARFRQALRWRARPAADSIAALIFLLGIVALGIGAETIRANSKLRSKAAAAAMDFSRPGTPAGAFSPDKGKFKILVNGQQAGTEDFSLSASGGNWVARGNAEIQTPQGAAHVAGNLEMKPDGTPVRYEWSMTGAKKAGSTIVFNGTTAAVELRMEGARPYTQQFTFTSDRVVVLDNNMYDQYAVLARFYDWDKKGAQSFAVFVPQEMTPGTVTVESLGKQDKLEQLRVKTEDLEIDLFLDGQRLVRLVSPSANAEIIRE
ncbi:MAG: hypothetical protein ACRD59_06270 [Candidatus Acidiferrales bacterium]